MCSSFSKEGNLVSFQTFENHSEKDLEMIEVYNSMSAPVPMEIVRGQENYESLLQEWGDRRKRKRKRVEPENNQVRREPFYYTQILGLIPFSDQAQDSAPLTPAASQRSSDSMIWDFGGGDVEAEGAGKDVDRESVGEGEAFDELFGGETYFQRSQEEAMVDGEKLQDVHEDLSEDEDDGGILPEEIVEKGKGGTYKYQVKKTDVDA